MNTEKVFTAFNKDGEELLLYRKDRDTYIDLNSENNDIYNKDDIDLKTLVHASKSINLRKHMLESSIKRKYKKDREKLLETKNILFGGEFTIKNLQTTEIETEWKWFDIPLNDYHYEWDTETTENLLNLFMFSRKVVIKDYTFNVYINLYDKEEYILFNGNVKHISSLPDFGEGMKYNKTTDYTLEDYTEETVLEKKKIYEYSYEIRKKEHYK